MLIDTITQAHTYNSTSSQAHHSLCYCMVEAFYQWFYNTTSLPLVEVSTIQYHKLATGRVKEVSTIQYHKLATGRRVLYLAGSKLVTLLPVASLWYCIAIHVYPYGIVESTYWFYSSKVIIAWHEWMWKCDSIVLRIVLITDGETDSVKLEGHLSLLHTPQQHI